MNIRDTGLEIQVEANYIKSAYVGSIGIIKRLRMNLQFLWNLEVGNTELEIRIGAGCIKNWYCQVFENDFAIHLKIRNRKY